MHKVAGSGIVFTGDGTRLKEEKNLHLYSFK